MGPKAKTERKSGNFLLSSPWRETSEEQGTKHAERVDLLTMFPELASTVYHRGELEAKSTFLLHNLHTGLGPTGGDLDGSWELLGKKFTKHNTT